jgi:D-serine dehydratase
MDVEAQLSKYWSAAAIPLRHIDEELAMICEYKSDFWTNPDNWSEEEVKRIGIKLEDVTDAYRRLAMPRFSSLPHRKPLPK